MTGNIESKANNFKRIAEPRLERAVHAITLLMPLSDKNRYDYSEAQARYIVKELRDAVRELESAFNGNRVDKKIKLPPYGDQDGD